MPQCLIPNCSNEAIYFIGVRLRRPKDAQRPVGTAIWAPNSRGYLCDQHARDGYTINVQLIPAAARTITTSVSAGGITVTRVTPIVNLP